MLNATGAPFDSNSLTACKCPTRAAMCKAVAPCINMSAHQVCTDCASVMIKQLKQKQLGLHKLSMYIIA